MRRAAFFVVAALVLAGCTRVVPGEVRPAAGLAPQPLLGEAVGDALLGARGLGELFDQSFKAEARFPSHFGGREQLTTEQPRAQQDCIGAAHPMTDAAFADDDVRDVAWRTWWNASPYHTRPAAISVDEAVVALPTATAADAAFERIVEQWQRCDGMTVATGVDPPLEHRIDRVEVSNSIVSADGVESMGDSEDIPSVQAIGVRVNCIVVVSASFFRSSVGPVYEQRDHAQERPETLAVVHRMMDRISELT